MQFIGYDWELTDKLLVPDNEIDCDKLGWKAGDYWQVKQVDGKLVFKKVDPIVQFLLEGSMHG